MRTVEQTSVLSPQDRIFLSNVKQLICGMFPESTVLLYGSVARGTQDNESDYDLLVLTPNALSPSQQYAVEDALYEIELSREAVISVVFRCQQDWDKHQTMPFYKAIDRDAIKL